LGNKIINQFMQGFDAGIRFQGPNDMWFPATQKPKYAHVCTSAAGTGGDEELLRHEAMDEIPEDGHNGFSGLIIEKGHPETTPNKSFGCFSLKVLKQLSI